MNDRVKAFWWMVLASLCYAFLAIDFKFLAKRYPVFEMIFARNFTAFVFLSFFLILRGIEKIKFRNLKLLTARGVLGSFAALFYFYALSKLPVATVITIQKTAPFLIIILSWFFLKEKSSKYKFIAFFIAFAGILLIFKPGYNSGKYFYLFLPVCSAFFSAIAHTIIRKLGESNEPAVIVWFFFFVSNFILAPLMIYQGIEIPDGVFDWSLVLLLGVFTMSAQLSMTKSYSLTKVGEASLYSYINIPFATFLAFLFFGELPDKVSFIGISLVLYAAYVNYREKILI
ncbi:conserved hypothetical protein [Thermotomaculum hydrothermale]|uniref:EamA domain-containing protein n=1 Tax=Thermotomaculum hydrothermale TaxID=981385 RepID=A0A7R6SYG9_9BACT|nr:DMT family transporter [Thermotomaculum hydrothermale]BBB32551.1 conserved hypothetical protein [Thermotomaculum hydrothermale]